MKRISKKRLRELEENYVRINQLMNELQEYALQHGYSDIDLYDAAYAFTVESLSIVSKKDAREVLRKLEEGADGLREVLRQKRKKTRMTA